MCGLLLGSQITIANAASLASAKALSANERQTLIKAIANTLEEHYVFPKLVPTIIKRLHQRDQAGAYENLGAQAFVDAVNADLLQYANDKHLRLRYSSEALPQNEPEQPLDAAEEAKFIARFKRQNYRIPKVEVLAGNVGYLRMDMFVPAEFAAPTVAAAMTFLQHSDAMIIDLRNNVGGHPDLVQFAVSYFLPADTHFNSFHQRGVPVDAQMWTLPYVPGGRWSTTKPVYVLTSKRTGSGAEEFAYDLQQLKRAVIVGEPTWGGANPGGDIVLNAHFKLFVPYGAAVNPISKSNWEGKGVIPDVSMSPEASLPAVHRMAIEKMLPGADEGQREYLQAALEELK